MRSRFAPLLFILGVSRSKKEYDAAQVEKDVAEVELKEELAVSKTDETATVDQLEMAKR